LFCFCGFNYFAESGAGHDANLLAEKLLRRYLVKAAFKTLYGNFVCHKIKIPALLAGILFIRLLLVFELAKAFPAPIKIEVKVKPTVCF
jgi:hypothetical protein